jgi:hypothetical protein
MKIGWKKIYVLYKVLKIIYLQMRARGNGAI